jgi:hypothetical protein
VPDHRPVNSSSFPRGSTEFPPMYVRTHAGRRARQRVATVRSELVVAELRNRIKHNQPLASSSAALRCPLHCAIVPSRGRQRRSAMRTPHRPSAAACQIQTRACGLQIERRTREGKSPAAHRAARDVVADALRSP